MPLVGETAIIPRTSRRQESKLRRLLIEAKINVPFYGRRYASVDLTKREVSVPRLLAQLPILSKTELLDASMEDRLNRRFRPEQLVAESTTGSTGQPFTVHMDRSYLRRRNLRFVCALMSTGYRPWQRLMLLTDRFSTPTTRNLTWHYVPVESPTAAIAEAYERIRPQVLYGFATPLRLLADYLKTRRAGTPCPRLIISTAEMLDPATRQRLALAFRCPVFDFYGMTEMGLVAWQRPGSSGYVMSENSTLTEFVPDPSGERNFKMIMTNLDLHASPIIRFDSGDIATVQMTGDTPVLESISGRCIDSIQSRDGSELSPYRITDAFRDIPGLRQFKVTQMTLADFRVDIQADDDMRTDAARQIKKILQQLLGENLDVEIRNKENLIPNGSRKFRPVESRLSRI